MGQFGDMSLKQGDVKEAVPADVAAVFAAFPEGLRTLLLEARALIFEVAEDAKVDPLTETLKWGEPAYLTQATKAGSTVRLGVKDGRAAVFFICTSGLVDGFRADFPELSYLGNRGVFLDTGTDRAALALCLRRALTHHRGKRSGQA
jgi:hypothetical protein